MIFDEFHERALQADLGLALALEVRGALRPDLRLLVMSATLDAAPVAALMGEAPVITAEGRAFPVETRWLDRPWRGGAGQARASRRRWRSWCCDALGGDRGRRAGLPAGAGRDRPGGGAAGAAAAGGGAWCSRCMAGCPSREQRAALAPLAAGRRLVLATAIAETSLTIPDVRVVVDGGRARRARFDPGSGMSRLVTERVTRAEAEQRRGPGRAGGAGLVLPALDPRRGGRRWRPSRRRRSRSADLTGLALELALWGVGRRRTGWRS